jgi:hypothetical protein
MPPTEGWGGWELPVNQEVVTTHDLFKRDRSSMTNARSPSPCRSAYKFSRSRSPSLCREGSQKFMKSKSRSPSQRHRLIPVILTSSEIDAMEDKERTLFELSPGPEDYNEPENHLLSVPASPLSMNLGMICYSPPRLGGLHYTNGKPPPHTSRASSLRKNSSCGSSPLARPMDVAGDVESQMSIGSLLCDEDIPNYIEKTNGSLLCDEDIPNYTEKTNGSLLGSSSSGGPTYSEGRVKNRPATYNTSGGVFRKIMKAIEVYHTNFDKTVHLLAIFIDGRDIKEGMLEELENDMSKHEMAFSMYTDVKNAWDARNPQMYKDLQCVSKLKKAISACYQLELQNRKTLRTASTSSGIIDKGNIFVAKKVLKKKVAIDEHSKLTWNLQGICNTAGGVGGSSKSVMGPLDDFLSMDEGDISDIYKSVNDNA